MSEKTDLQKAFEYIEKMPVSWKGKGPLIPVKDENGIVHLQDQNGVTYLLMDESTYQSILDYNAKK